MQPNSTVDDREQDPAALYIRDFARLEGDLFCPELKVYNTRRFAAFGDLLRERGIGPGGPIPFWAVVWPGGRGLARYLLDRPELCRGRRVLDLGCGNGIVAAAAARGGARVEALDRDASAVTIARSMLAANELEVVVRRADLFEREPAGLAEYELLLAGDLTYDESLARRLVAFLRRSGRPFLLADPERGFVPEDLPRLARLRVPVLPEIDNVRARDVSIYGRCPGTAGESIA